LAKWLIVVGAALCIAGVLLHLFPGMFAWFGRLPGDIRIETERTKVFFPWVSMLIISVVLSIVLSFLRR